MILTINLNKSDILIYIYIYWKGKHALKTQGSNIT